jgi:hypothetical protein
MVTKTFEPMYDKRIVDMTNEELARYYPALRNHAARCMEIDGVMGRKRPSRQTGYAFKLESIMIAVMRKRNLI